MSKAVKTTEVLDPHDTFFRQLLSEPTVAVDFVQNYLPAEIVPLLDLAQLRIEKDTFVDGRLRKHFSDVLYSVPLQPNLLPSSQPTVAPLEKPAKRKRKKAEPDKIGVYVYLYLLFEHKSQPDKGVRLQVLRYMTRIWEKEWKKHRQLSPIVPIVFYHGQETWNYSSEFADLLTVVDVFKPYLPQFRHLLIDLSAYSDEQIQGEVWLRVNLLILKHIFDDNLGEQLPKILGLLRTLVQNESGLEMLYTVLMYITEASAVVTEAELYQGVIAAVTPERSNVVESLAQKWIKEGIEKGVEEGIEKGIEKGIEAQRQTLLRLVEWRFSLSEEAQQAYAQQLARIHNLDHLLHLVDQLLTMQTSAAFDQAILAYLPNDEKSK